jgi:hypothetical protein
VLEVSSKSWRFSTSFVTGRSMTKKKRDNKEIIDNDPPLQDIIPDTEAEKKRKRDQDAVIRQNILDEFKENEKEKAERKREDRKRKINKTRKCIARKTLVISGHNYNGGLKEVRL